MYTLSFSHKYQYELSRIGIEVPVVMTTGTRRIEILTKVDTGAENCIFAREVGGALGLDIETGHLQQFSTANGGRFAAYGHWVQLTSLGVESESLVYFAADPLFRRNVLGRQGWLDKVRLALVDYDRLLYLAAYDT